MKKIIWLGIICLCLTLFSCNMANQAPVEGIGMATDYLASLDSYELSGTMTIKRSQKDLNVNIEVCYLKPSYYIVSFGNNTENEQIIIKNDEGVFVVTPSLNKEFKFDSQWPLNSSHAYLLEAIVNDIKADTAATYQVTDKVMMIEAKLLNANNTKYKAMRFYFDTEARKPLKTIFLNDKNEEVVTMNILSFEPNKSFKKEIFNSKAVLDSKNTNGDGATNKETLSLVISVSYICEGATLKSSDVSQFKTILCYSGDKSYTLVAQRVNAYQQSVLMDTYSAYDYGETGLIMFSNSGCRVYNADVEISIYTTKLSQDEMVSVIDQITIG